MKFTKPLAITAITTLSCAAVSLLLVFLTNIKSARGFIDMAFYAFGIAFVVGVIITSVSIWDFLMAPPPSRKKTTKKIHQGALWEIASKQKQNNAAPSNVEPVSQKPRTILGLSIITGSMIWWATAYLIYSGMIH